MTSLLKLLLLFLLQKLVYLLAEENLPTVIAVRQRSFAPAGQKLSFRQKLWIFFFLACLEFQLNHQCHGQTKVFLLLRWVKIEFQYIISLDLFCL